MGFREDICLNCGQRIALVRRDIRRGWYHPGGWTVSGKPYITGSWRCKMKDEQEITRAIPARGVAVILNETGPKTAQDTVYQKEREKLEIR